MEKLTLIIEKILKYKIQHFNPDKYFKMREYVCSEGGRKLLKFYYLYQIKRCDAFNNASLGTHIGYGAKFGSMPVLPHGLNGIIISHGAVIGKNCIIGHQVTIGNVNGQAPVIGDNVFIGAGSKIIGNIVVGNNVKIGVNCIVCEDIPDNSTVVMHKPRIIVRKESWS